MVSITLLAFLALQVIIVLGLGKNVLINFPELKKEQLNWPQQKIQTIEYLINTLSDVGNVTLIGSQQIWNGDGSLKEVRSIELTILAQSPTTLVSSSEEREFDEELRSVKETTKSLLSSTGISLSGGYVQNNRYGSVIKRLRVNPNDTYVREDGKLPFWHRNMPISSPAKIRSKAKSLMRNSPLPASFLQFTNGTFDLSPSIIVPELLASVASSTGANITVLEAALTASVKGVFLQPDDVTLYVSSYMKKKLPGLNWIVGQNWLGFSSYYDVSVKIQFNPIPDEFSTPMYIIGVPI